MDTAYWKKEEANIWASDMRDMEATSSISEIFDDATIFLTGATGFLGKLFLEKLLRASPNLRRVYILVRPKKGVDAKKRFSELFDGPNMVPLKLTNPKFLDQVSMIHGDCSKPNLGMEEEDIKKFKEEVNYVIHCAATVRFDQHIRTAAYINVRSLLDLVSIAKETKGLKAFLHVSTAYCFCVRRDIDEEFYNPVMEPEQLLDLVEMLDEDRLTNITPGLIGEWPNTYVFTKAIAEHIVKREVENMPIAMVRPSIVVPTVNEPVKGWIDSMYGPTGVLVGAALGVLRTMKCDMKKVADMIPADYVINASLAIMWNIVETRSAKSGGEIDDASKDKETPVYNIVSSTESPVTWGDFMNYSYIHAIKVPSELQVWHYVFVPVTSDIALTITMFLLHTVPSHLIDFICICIGKEPIMVNGYKRINKFVDVLAYFAAKEWRFQNYNMQNLWKRMKPEDKKRYHFSMKDFNWDSFFHFSTRGGRVYLLKDPLDTIPKGRVKYLKLVVAHYTLVGILLFLFAWLLCFLCRCIF